MDVLSWDIIIKEDAEKTLNILLEEFCNINENTKIYFWLDLEKKEYTIFEKLIYDIAAFHFNRLGLDINDRGYFVECWTHYRFCSNYSLHIDVDEPEYKKNKQLFLPFLTTLTYFNNIKNPTMILNVTEDQYSKNEYQNCDTYFSFPKMLKHVAFEGNKYYHGAINYFGDTEGKNDRYILGMNLWKRPLAFVEKYNFNIYNNHDFRFKQLFYINKHYSIFMFKQCDEIKTIKVNHTIMSQLEDGEKQHDFFKVALKLSKKRFHKEYKDLIKESDLIENTTFKIRHEPLVDINL